MPRDNFRPPVVRRLRDRVATRCSNPECRVPTTAATELGSGVNNIGVAAHITAAASGGPRFDGSLTASKRRAFENGIWLCASCSVRIDRDVAKYTVGVLRSWKTAAEATAVAELGRPLPAARDVVDTVAAALTSSGSRFVAGAVSNTAKASAQVLEAMDSRFAVDVTYDGATTRFQMNARVDVPIQLRIHADKDVDLPAINEALCHGQDVEIPLQAVEVDGSPLLRYALERGGKLRIEPHKVPIVARLSLVSTTGANWRFDDLSGLGTMGTNGITFAGDACGGLVTMALRAAPKVPVSFTLNVDFKRWKGTDVRVLPHWDSVFTLVERLVAGDALHVAFFKDGVAGPSGTGSLNEPEKMAALWWLLQHAAAALVVAKLTNTAIAFDRWGEITPSDDARLVEVADEIENKRVRRAADLTGNVTFAVKLPEPVPDLRTALGPGNFRIDEPEGEVVHAFGQPVRLPPRRTIFEAVEPRVEGPDTRGYFNVELVFASRSLMRTEYGHDANQAPPRADSGA